MTKKRRDGEDTGVSRGRGAKKTPGTPPGEERRATDPGAAEAKPKISLPAFGFAADVLGPRGGDRAGGTPPADVTATPNPLPGLSGPERIFAFADSLSEEAPAEATEATPAVIETWLTLMLRGEIYGLPVESVREVLRVSQITRVPQAPKPVRGVTNLRGRVIPVIDLRLRLELPVGDLERASRIVVVDSRGRLIGLLVDAVLQVVHLDLNRVEPTPEDVVTVQSDYILGVYQQTEQLILLLDVDRVLIIKEAGAA